MTHYNITSQIFTFSWICMSLSFGIDSLPQFPPSVFTEHQTWREAFGRRIFMLDFCLHFTSNFNCYRYLCTHRYINSAFDSCRIYCIYLLRIYKLCEMWVRKHIMHISTSLRQFPWHWRDPACILNICPMILINLTCPAAVQACLMGLFVSATQYLLHRNTNTKRPEAWKMYRCISHACSKNYFLFSYTYNLME